MPWLLRTAARCHPPTSHGSNPATPPGANVRPRRRHTAPGTRRSMTPHGMTPRAFRRPWRTARPPSAQGRHHRFTRCDRLGRTPPDVRLLAVRRPPRSPPRRPSRRPRRRPPRRPRTLTLTLLVLPPSGTILLTDTLPAPPIRRDRAIPPAHRTRRGRATRGQDRRSPTRTAGTLTPCTGPPRRGAVPAA
jgi:hypothetical protein